MARFIVIHDIPPQATQDQIIGGAKNVVASLTSGTEWLNSWMVPEARKLFCEWEAPDANAIRSSLESVKHLFPIESLYEVEWVDPKWYR